jgi:hypothetical protein
MERSRGIEFCGPNKSTTWAALQREFRAAFGIICFLG